MNSDRFCWIARDPFQELFVICPFSSKGQFDITSSPDTQGSDSPAQLTVSLPVFSFGYHRNTLNQGGKRHRRTLKPQICLPNLFLSPPLLQASSGPVVYLQLWLLLAVSGPSTPVAPPLVSPRLLLFTLLYSLVLAPLARLRCRSNNCSCGSTHLGLRVRRRVSRLWWLESSPPRKPL